MGSQQTVTMSLDVKNGLVRDETGTWCGLDSFLFRQECKKNHLTSHSTTSENKQLFIFSKGR